MVLNCSLWKGGEGGGREVREVGRVYQIPEKAARHSSGKTN